MAPPVLEAAHDPVCHRRQEAVKGNEDQFLFNSGAIKIILNDRCGPYSEAGVQSSFSKLATKTNPPIFLR
jgi:hypothetical protein